MDSSTLAWGLNLNTCTLTYDVQTFSDIWSCCIRFSWFSLLSFSCSYARLESSHFLWSSIILLSLWSNWRRASSRSFMADCVLFFSSARSWIKVIMNKKNNLLSTQKKDKCTYNQWRWSMNSHVKMYMYMYTHLKNSEQWDLSQTK